MAVKAKQGVAKVQHVSRARFKKTSIGNSVRSKAKSKARGRKKRIGQGR